MFQKTKEQFGALSNMASGFPLRVNGIDIRTSEALYQACRFPRFPAIQGKIIGERSPMAAKMKGKPHLRYSRPDWDNVRVEIMYWCLQVKLAQNWSPFRGALLGTGDSKIVEQSRRDDFWGAKPMGNTRLVGANVLGHLLMKLRERIKSNPPSDFWHVDPLRIKDFLLYDEQIEKVHQFTDDNSSRLPGI